MCSTHYRADLRKPFSPYPFLHIMSVAFGLLVENVILWFLTGRLCAPVDSYVIPMSGGALLHSLVCAFSAFDGRHC